MVSDTSTLSKEFETATWFLGKLSIEGWLEGGVTYILVVNILYVHLVCQGCLNQLSGIL